MRITIDLDHKKDLGRCVKRFREIFLFNPIDEIYLSASRKGYHIICHDLAIDFYMSWILRNMLLDDPKRVQIDLWRDEKGQVTQVLWNKKGKNRVKKVYDRIRKINKLPKSIKI